MSDRETLVVAVWKEKLTYNQSLEEAKRIVFNVRAEDWPFLIGIAPNPFSYIGVRDVLKNTNIRLVSQNVLWEADSGSFIGEVTGAMLKEAGCHYVIVGHSERRLYFHEDDIVIARKVGSILEIGSKPILCFGDNMEEKESGKTREVIRRQLGVTFDQLSEKLSPSNILLAYEPVWAISTWRSSRPLPTGSEISELHDYIRSIIGEIAGSSFANEVLLLYGGSVSEGNASDYLSHPGIDGALVGGASQTSQSFIATLRSARTGVEKRRMLCEQKRE